MITTKYNFYIEITERSSVIWERFNKTKSMIKLQRDTLHQLQTLNNFHNNNFTIRASCENTCWLFYSNIKSLIKRQAYIWYSIYCPEIQTDYQVMQINSKYETRFGAMCTRVQIFASELLSPSQVYVYMKAT